MVQAVTMTFLTDRNQPNMMEIACAIESAYTERNDPSAAKFETDKGVVLVVITLIGMESEESGYLIIGGRATIAGERRGLRIRYNPKTKDGTIRYDA